MHPLLADIAVVVRPFSALYAKLDSGAFRVLHQDVIRIRQGLYDFFRELIHILKVDVHKTFHHVSCQSRHHADPAMLHSGFDHVSSERLFFNPRIKHVSDCSRPLCDFCEKTSRLSDGAESFCH